MKNNELIFPQKLKELRGKIKLSQRELSKRLGLNSMAIRDYENGTKLPRKENVKNLSHIFGYDTQLLQTLVDIDRYNNRKHIIVK